LIETTETIGGDMGITVLYKQKEEYAHVSVEFFAAEITGLGTTDGKTYNVPSYWRNGASSSSEDTEDFTEAERYVAGFVKWDGCSHYNFGDENGYLNLCGPEHIRKLSNAISVIFERCGELMLSSGGKLLEGQFACERERA
jgi:hypothetical protein